MIIALYHNAKVPKLWRILMPILLVGNILAFAFNSSDGAKVGLVATIGGFQSPIFVISTFELIQSIKDMWNAKTYALSILIALWSGLWPYIKLFFMLLTWFLSAQQMSFKIRERLLIVLDTMGKWSILDSFMLIMQLVAFHLQMG